MAEQRCVSRLQAYPVEIQATQERDGTDALWGPMQFTLLFEGQVQATLSEEAAKLYARFIAETVKAQTPEPVARDRERFSKMTADPRPVMPDLPPEDVPIQLVRSMIRARRDEAEGTA
jgi:hypothetical protein